MAAALRQRAANRAAEDPLTDILSLVASLPYTQLVADLGLSDGHRVMVDAVPPGARALDVGCAGGYLAELLAAAGCTVVGVEPDAAAAAAARAHCESVDGG